jgi:Predicted hydrolases or acyltransferases (alpha/beta hydrolase superfamily)
MKKNIMGINLNYVDYGVEDGNTILLIHGWGQNIEMMKGIGDSFSKEYRIVIIDLPGFGKSSVPEFAWNVSDYVECIKLFLEELKIDKLIIAGHSYGGKIGLLYASKYEVEKLILFGSPFKKEIKNLSLKTKILKQLKKVPGLNKLEGFAKKHIGSEDYRNATPLMRETLVNTVNLDITEEIKKIKASALIIWGTNDEAVPVERAYELEKLIADAGVVIFEGCTHYAYLERLKQTINVMRIFLES